MSAGEYKSIFKIVNGLRYFGVGTKITRQLYKFPETYWILTKVKLSKDQNHGEVRGRLVWRGRAKPKDEKIGGPLKKEWKLIGLPEYNKFENKPGQVEEIIKNSAEQWLEVAPPRVLSTFIPPSISTSTSSSSATTTEVQSSQ